MEQGDAPGKLSRSQSRWMSSVKGPGVPGAVDEAVRLPWGGDDLDLLFIKGCLDERRESEGTTVAQMKICHEIGTHNNTRRVNLTTLSENILGHDAHEIYFVNLLKFSIYILQPRLIFSRVLTISSCLQHSSMY